MSLAVTGQVGLADRPVFAAKDLLVSRRGGPKLDYGSDLPATLDVAGHDQPWTRKRTTLRSYTRVRHGRAEDVASRLDALISEAG